MKKTKINHRLNIAFIGAVIIYISVIILLLVVINRFYIDFKLDSAQLKIAETTNNQEGYIELEKYLVESGFTLQIQDLSQTKNGGNDHQGFSLDISSEEVKYIRYSDGFTIAINNFIVHATININIVEDIITLLILFAIISIVMFIILIYFLKKFINNVVVKRLLLLQKHIKDISKFDEVQQPLSFTSNDEINDLLIEIDRFQLAINQNLKDQETLVRSFAHELKTPLSLINAILFLYENEKEPFLTYDQAKQGVNKEIMKADNLIESSIKLFQSSNKNNVEAQNLNSIIKQYLEDNEVIIKQKRLKIIHKEMAPFIIMLSDEQAMFITSNIISNAIKHVANDETIKIISNKNILVIANKINFQQRKSNYPSGNEIINFFAKKGNTQITRRTNKDIYIVKLEKF